MASFSTAKMSSKGQIIIPEDIRKKMNLKPGSQFVGGKGAVVLKEITAPR
jgi:AbrB family looped-hinge helix DNA binding protein